MDNPVHTLTPGQEIEALKAQIERDHAVRTEQYRRYVAAGYIDEMAISLTDFVQHDYVIASVNVVTPDRLAALEQAAAERDRLREAVVLAQRALDVFGKHHPGCPVPDHCTCKLWETQRKIELVLAAPQSQEDKPNETRT